MIPDGLRALGRSLQRHAFRFKALFPTLFEPVTDGKIKLPEGKIKTWLGGGGEPLKCYVVRVAQISRQFFHHQAAADPCAYPVAACCDDRAITMMTLQWRT